MNASTFYELLADEYKKRRLYVLDNEVDCPSLSIQDLANANLRFSLLGDSEVVCRNFSKTVCQLEQSSPPSSPPTAPADSAVVLLPHGSQPREFRLSMGELSLVLDFISSVRKYRLTGKPSFSKIEQRNLSTDGSIYITLHIGKHPDSVEKP